MLPGLPPPQNLAVCSQHVKTMSQQQQLKSQDRPEPPTPNCSLMASPSRAAHRWSILRRCRASLTRAIRTRALPLAWLQLQSWGTETA